YLVSHSSRLRTYVCTVLLFFFMLRPPPSSTLFPYTTLFRSYLLRVAEERALSIVVERLDLLRRNAVPAAHGSVDVLSELAAVPRRHAPIEQRPQCHGHALRLLLERGPHRRRGAEVRRVARVEQVGIERRTPELRLFLERF